MGFNLGLPDSQQLAHRFLLGSTSEVKLAEESRKLPFSELQALLPWPERDLLLHRFALPLALLESTPNIML